jgi:hypothetical protein
LKTIARKLHIGIALDQIWFSCKLWAMRMLGADGLKSPAVRQDVSGSIAGTLMR